MNGRRPQCRLFRPSLVALVYGEGHPEARLLQRHLRACARCRREARELAVVRAGVEAAFAAPRIEARLRRAGPRAALAAIGVAIVIALAASVPFRMPGLLAGGGGAGSASGLAVMAALAAGENCDTYGGEELDRRTDRLADELEALELPEGDGW
jgi:anti-sigma factor RsiW